VFIKKRLNEGKKSLGSRGRRGGLIDSPLREKGYQRTGTLLCAGFSREGKKKKLRERGETSSTINCS